MSPPTAPKSHDPGQWDRVWRLLGRYDRLPIDPDLAPDDPSEPAAGHLPSTVPHDRRDPAVLACIGAGGFIGTLGRYEVGMGFPSTAGTFPFTTFAINTSGAFALGVILTIILERLRPIRYLRAFTCVGVLGAWTTMSTFAMESVVLAENDQLPTALVYMMATLVCGTVATALGIAVARRSDEVPHCSR